MRGAAEIPYPSFINYINTFSLNSDVQSKVTSTEETFKKKWNQKNIIFETIDKYNTRDTVKFEFMIRKIVEWFGETPSAFGRICKFSTPTKSFAFF